ncbi:GNAT family N-acetyltransferase [Actinosynnema sp. NPDC050436]|uniref:GNAT family N-acetyltransferase n=1 Tax=Actinosynnema sp. NPDC050436 TaxID=3155659 RepID=UPI003404CFEC
MTDLLAHHAPASVGQSSQDARAAADRAGVGIRELDALPELTAAYELYRRIWRPDAQHVALTVEILRALSKAGGYVVGAYAGDVLVGLSVGLNGVPASGRLHSHMAGVAPEAQGRNVGLALKLHQRAWALASGISSIAWTFDPLVRRNAHFNLAKLGARPEAYLTDFYGPMTDGINCGDASDRLLVGWDLSAPFPPPGAVDDAGVPPLLRCADDGTPFPVPAEGPLVAVPTPAHVETLRRDAPGVAAAWRQAVRGALAGELSTGAAITGFSRNGCYLVARKDNA